MKHTKGPWEVGVVRDNGSCTITAPGTVYIATLWPWVGWADKDEVEANAQLMATAPNLLEALEALAFNAIKTDDLADSTPLYIPCTAGELRSARAAIAKAKG